MISLPGSSRSARKFARQPLLLFLNVGETHVPYWHAGALWDRDDNPCVPFQRPSQERRRTCRRRQRACLEYVDVLLAPLLEVFRDSTIVLTADHGDCWGEDGLWEQGSPVAVLWRCHC